MTNEEMNALMQKALEQETEFLEEGEFIKNEHGVYIYSSPCGTLTFSLDHILRDYKEWLIEKKYVREPR